MQFSPKPPMDQSFVQIGPMTICIPWQVKSPEEIRKKNFSEKLEKPHPQKEVWKSLSAIMS